MNIEHWNRKDQLAQCNWNFSDSLHECFVNDVNDSCFVHSCINTMETRILWICPIRVLKCLAYNWLTFTVNLYHTISAKQAKSDCFEEYLWWQSSILLISPFRTVGNTVAGISCHCIVWLIFSSNGRSLPCHFRTIPMDSGKCYPTLEEKNRKWLIYEFGTKVKCESDMVVWGCFRETSIETIRYVGFE